MTIPQGPLIPLFLVDIAVNKKVILTPGFWVIGVTSRRQGGSSLKCPKGESDGTVHPPLSCHARWKLIFVCPRKPRSGVLPTIFFWPFSAETLLLFYKKKNHHANGTWRTKRSVWLWQEPGTERKDLHFAWWMRVTRCIKRRRTYEIGLETTEVSSRWNLTGPFTTFLSIRYASLNMMRTLAARCLWILTVAMSVQVLEGVFHPADKTGQRSKEKSK